MRLMTADEHKAARAKIDAVTAWLQAGKRDSYRPEELTAAGLVDVGNEVRGQVEIFEFLAQTDEAARKPYFAYFKDKKDDGERSMITTWMGDMIAQVVRTNEYKVPAFGSQSVRVAFRAYGIDGRLWSGTFYKSSGDYCRMRAIKPIYGSQVERLADFAKRWREAHGH